MRKLLVTGGCGFIGANFVRYWTSSHPEDEVTVLDALTYSGNLASIADLLDSGATQFVAGDICDPERVRETLVQREIDTIVHFAAESHVDRSIRAPDEFLRTNILGTHELIRVARTVWRNGDSYRPHVRFHHVSTDEVFGSLEAAHAPFSESHPYQPNSPYAATKAASDHLVRAYFHTYGVPTTTSNCSNNYGPYHFPEKLIPLAIVNALDGNPIAVYGDGLQVRDWLFVEDHCRGIDAILHQGQPGETYNIGGDCERTNLDLLYTLCSVVDEAFETQTGLRDRFTRAPAARGIPTSSLLSFVTDRPGHDRRYAVDASRARRELGFSPHVSLADGLRRTVEWYLSNEDWWRAVMDGSYREWLTRQYGAAV